MNDRDMFNKLKELKDMFQIIGIETIPVDITFAVELAAKVIQYKELIELAQEMIVGDCDTEFSEFNCCGKCSEFDWCLLRSLL